MNESYRFRRLLRFLRLKKTIAITKDKRNLPDVDDRKDGLQNSIRSIKDSRLREKSDG